MPSVIPPSRCTSVFDRRCRAVRLTSLFPTMSSEMLNTTPSITRTDALFLEQRRTDPTGHTIHAWLGALACALLCAPTSVMEFCAAPVGVCFLIRLPRHWRLDLRLLRQPVLWLVLLWAVWMAASVLWSPDVK